MKFGKALKSSKTLEILMGIKANVDSVNLGGSVVAVGQGPMKSPVIIWMRNLTASMSLNTDQIKPYEKGWKRLKSFKNFSH